MFVSLLISNDLIFSLAKGEKFLDECVNNFQFYLKIGIWIPDSYVGSGKIPSTYRKYVTISVTRQAGGKPNDENHGLKKERNHFIGRKQRFTERISQSEHENHQKWTF